MKHPRAYLTSIGIGMMAMYVFDPNLGHRRRALLRDRLRGTGHDLSHFMDVARRDLQQRLIGMSHELRSHFADRKVTDDTLKARIAAKMGHYVSHPRAVKVSVKDGVVSLEGHVLTHEAHHLVRALKRIPGVNRLHSELVEHSIAEHFEALEGGPERRRHRPSFLQDHWSPATRLVAGTLGVLSILEGLRRSPVSETLLISGGALLLGRSIINRPVQQMMSPESRRDPQKSKGRQESSDMTNRSAQASSTALPESGTPTLH